MTFPIHSICSIGTDSRIGPRFLQAGLGFGDSCFQEEILNLVYPCRDYGLEEVAGAVLNVSRGAEGWCR